MVNSPRVRAALESATDPVVVDLGYGRLPVTTLELATRLRAVRSDVRVVGLEIDPQRVVPDTDGVEFKVGGFELAGLQPVLVRGGSTCCVSIPRTPWTRPGRRCGVDWPRAV